MVEVALVRCESYINVKESISKSLKLLGSLSSFIKPDQKILLKPNICDPLPSEKSATTHPLFVKAVIELVKEITPYVDVGEQAASNEKGITKRAHKESGIEKIQRETGTKFRNLQEGEFVAKEIKDYKILDKTDFSRAIFEYDLIINLPKFKTHQLTYITGAVKNCFGLIHPDERQYLHREFPKKEDFSQGIVDVYSFVKPKIILNLMDCVVAMDGNEGPSYGRPLNMGYVIAGIDAVSVDAVASYMTGHNPMAIPTTKYAQQRGLGTGDISKIKILGDELKQSEMFEQNLLYKNRNKNLRFQPEISARCRKCGVCFRNCPAKAIELIEGRYSINKKKCIRCYCCMEMCIYEAIELQNFQKKLKEANLRLGLICNQKCLFCTVANDGEKTISTKDAKEKIALLAAKGVNRITLTGGEPTIRSDLVELFKYSTKLGIGLINLQTNGMELSKIDYLTKLKNAGLTSALVALHSHRKDVSNILTQSNGYHNTVEAIKNIVKLDIKLAISHVVNSLNYRELLEFAKFSRDIAIGSHIYFGFIRPNGRTQENTRLVPKLSDVEFYLIQVMEFLKHNNITFSVEGIPLCYMNGFEKYSEETQRMLREPQMYVGSGKSEHSDLHKFINTNLKIKSKNCKICHLNEYCVGVWKEYAEIYNTSELYPIFNEVNIHS